MSSYCSVAEFELELPSLSEEDQEAGGTGTIYIQSKSGISVPGFSYDFRKAGDPEVLAFFPMALDLDGGEEFQIYLKNFPNAIEHCIQVSWPAGARGGGR